jgi:hypothetical protein
MAASAFCISPQDTLSGPRFIPIIGLEWGSQIELCLALMWFLKVNKI